MKKTYITIECVLLCCFFLLLSMRLLWAEEIVFITHKTVSDQILKKTIKNIYLGKKTKWDNHQKIVFYTLNSENIHDAFSSQYMNKTSQQFNNYWKRQVFTGKGSIPKSTHSIDEMIEWVENTPGAIGFIPKQEIKNNNIRVIYVND